MTADQPTPGRAPEPGALQEQQRRIVIWHARGHDALDDAGIPRFGDGMEYTIAERIGLLRAAVTPEPTAPDDRDLDACGKWCGERARHHHTRDEEGTVWTLPGPKPTAPDDLEREIARAIWEASHADEGTISYIGANIAAAAVMDVLRQNGLVTG